MKRLLIALLLIVVAIGHANAAPPPQSIIFDTDMGGDCDDVGALFVLHGAVERGEAKLLATMGCISSDAIAPCLDAINSWFGRAEIPVGTLKDPGFLVDPGYPAEIVRRFPHRFPASKDYPDALALYRQLLASQPDVSVVIVAVGPLRNMANLLKVDSALVAKKVKLLHVMGGHYPPDANKKDAEYNFQKDPVSAALVCEKWPTPVLFNGEGGSTNSGRRVTYEMPEHNPLTTAYAAYPGVGFAGDRLSWDPVSCLVAVRGAAPWYEVVSSGRNVVDAATGMNMWQPGGEQGHAYLVLKKGLKAAVETALEDMMTAGKGHPANLKFNTAYYAEAGMSQITASGAADATMAAGKAFDHDEKTAWLDKAETSWIQCQYADGRKSRVTSYAVVCREKARLPRTLELSGSNDGGSTWTRLDLQEAPAFTEQTTRREFSLRNPAKWNLYRLQVTAAEAKEGVQISTLELNEAIHCAPAVAVASIALDHPALRLPAHSRATLNATLAPLDTFDREVAWSSSDPAVAEVRRIGEQVSIVTAKQPGTCTITSTSGNVRQSCAVTVTASTLPAGWSFDELSAPPIPGSALVANSRFTLTGCGHAMTSWWERVRDQGVFASKPMIGDLTLSACLVSIAPSVGGPNAFPWDNRPPSASGLMIRESLAEACGCYMLVQVEPSGTLIARWRDKTGDQDDNQKKDLGKVTLPIHLKFVRMGIKLQVFTSTDGQNWGEPRMSHNTSFDAQSRIGLFVCSGNTFASTTAVFESILLLQK